MRAIELNEKDVPHIIQKKTRPFNTTYMVFPPEPRRSNKETKQKH